MGAGWAAVSVGPPQERSSRDAQAMPTNKITKRNMARRIAELERKIKETKEIRKYPLVFALCSDRLTPWFYNQSKGWNLFNAKSQRIRGKTQSKSINNPANENFSLRLSLPLVSLR